MRFLTTSPLPLLAAISAIFVSCTPMTGSPDGLVQRTDGAVSPLVARHELSPRAEPELEARQLEELVAAAAEIAVTVFEEIQADVKAAILDRGEFTTAYIESAVANFPKFNWVICHVKHTTAFDGVQGETWGHTHQEFDLQLGGTIGFEIYWFGSGKFVRRGDGGYENWAYDDRHLISRVDDNDQLSVLLYGPAS